MYTFFLPNTTQIDIDDVIDALGGSEFPMECFFDLHTGEVIRFPDPEDPFGDIDADLEIQRDVIDKNIGKRYIQFEAIPAHKQHEWMSGFVDMMVRQQHPTLAEKLDIALDGKGAFGRFKNVLAQEDGWLDSWYEWRSEQLYTEMIEWLSTIPIPIERKLELSDNCALCKVIQKEEQSPSI